MGTRVSRYSENFVDIYRRYCIYYIGTLDICFFFDIVSVTTAISAIFGYIVVLFRTIQRQFKDKIVSKIEYFIWQCDTSLHISISPKRKLRNNTDVIDYFAGNNEIYE